MLMKSELIHDASQSTEYMHAMKGVFVMHLAILFPRPMHLCMMVNEVLLRSSRCVHITDGN